MLRTLTSATLTDPDCDDWLSAPSFVAAMVRVEAALAESQVALGTIPAPLGEAVVAACRSFEPDLPALEGAAHRAGTPVPELVAQIGRQLEQHCPPARGVLHLGTTSQDILDTAMVLCVSRCVTRARAALVRGRRAAVGLARQHAHAPMLARTLMQAAGVTTFGYKAAQWAASLARCAKRLDEAASRSLVVQLAGATGNGQAFGDRWPALRESVAQRLELRPPTGSWQAMRDAWVALMTELSVCAGVAGKIADDVALMAQTEIGEADDPSAASGASSALPHKRNPVFCLRIRGASTMVATLASGLFTTMRVEHERGLGSWQAEQALTPLLVTHAVGALDTLASLLDGLVFHGDRARRHIEDTRGLIFADRALAALKTRLPPDTAAALVEEAAAEANGSGTHLRDVVVRLAASRGPEAGDEQALRALLDPAFTSDDAVAAAARAAEAIVRELEEGA